MPSLPFRLRSHRLPPPGGEKRPWLLPCPARKAASARQIEARTLRDAARELHESASALAEHASTLSSDLSALHGYLTNSGQTVDPGFMAAQISYLIRASRTAEQDASKLQAAAAAGSKP